MTEQAKSDYQANPGLHPGNRLAAKTWKTPWLGWQLAFKTRRSFGYASAFGTLGLIIQALNITIITMLLNNGSYSNTLPRMASFLWFIPALVGIGYYLGMFIYGYMILYLSSRFIDPEVRLFGGFGNLRAGWAILGAALYSAAFYSLLIGLFSFGAFLGFDFNRMGADAQLYLFAGAFPVLWLMQLVTLILVRMSIRWPAQRQAERQSLRLMLASPKFHGMLLLLSFSTWAAWAAATAASIAISIGIAVSAWVLFFIFVPVSLIIVSGYTLLVFGSVAVAPFRVAGWTLQDGENISSIFE